MKKKVAILGATGHIAQGLIERLRPDYIVTRYSRSDHRPLHMLFNDTHDVIINCIGVREALWTEPHRIFEITEYADSICLAYLDVHPETLCINFSSGAVYGGEFTSPAQAITRAMFRLNDMDAQAFYGIAKLNSEAKHRALDKYNIVDLRVFSYFSQYLRPDDPSLMGEVIRCIHDGRELVTSDRDFLRDYIHPDDLAQLVKKCIELHDLNTAVDAYSCMPTGKFDILNYFRDEYGLQYRIDRDYPETSPTGSKPEYYSNNMVAQDLGYYPEYTSMDAIKEEAEQILRLSGIRMEQRA